MQTIMLWPNIDAGADHISKAIRVFRDRVSSGLAAHHHESYLPSITSSCWRALHARSAIPAALCATPATSARRWFWWVIGRKAAKPMCTSRGWSRSRTQICARSSPSRWLTAVMRRSTLYGDGYVAGRIAESLVMLQPYIQKRLHYIYDEEVVNARMACGYLES